MLRYNLSIFDKELINSFNFTFMYYISSRGVSDSNRDLSDLVSIPTPSGEALIVVLRSLRGT